MLQINSVKQSILSHPAVYSSLQMIMGERHFRYRFVRDFIRPSEAMSILDIGCGPADILSYLPDVNYWGFDINAKYIANAIMRFGKRGKFHCHELGNTDLEKMPAFDIVLALGLLHHLNDSDVLNTLNLSFQSLKPGGRLLTVDPCLKVGQNAIARFLIKNDRGKYVRNREKYRDLANAIFKNPLALIQDQTWIPYTHCIMECTR